MAGAPPEPESVRRIRAFWESEPIGAAAIDAEPGTQAFFDAFDAIREDADCEPLDLQERIYRLSRAAGLRVLDYGCGNGYVLQQFARHGAEVHGIDLTERAVELSRARFSVRGLSGAFTVGDGRTIPYPDATFDVATSMGVLHHIPDPYPVLAEINRVLKPGGRFVLMLYHADGWHNLVLFRLKRLILPRYRRKSQAEAINMVDGDDNPYGTVYSRADATALLEGAGFSVEHSEVYELTWRQLLLVPPLWWAAEAMFGALSRTWIGRRLGWCLYLHATKTA